MIAIPMNVEIDCFDRNSKRRASVTHPGTNFVVRPTKDTVVIYNDLPRGGKGRAKYYREQNSQNNVIFVESVIDPKKPKNITSPKKISKILFDAPVILTSTLEAPPRKDGLAGRGVGYSIKVSMLKNGSHFSRGSEDPYLATKTTIKETLDKYIKDKTDIVIIRLNNTLKGKHPDYAEHPFSTTTSHGLRTYELLTAIYQLNDVLTFPTTAFIYVKNEGNVHNMIRTMAPDAQTLEEWAVTKFVTSIVNDISSNKNSMFVNYTDNSQIQSFNNEIKHVFKFVSLYGSMTNDKTVDNNSLLDTMYNTVKHVVEASNKMDFSYKSEACNVIQTLIKQNLVTYKHQSKINEFNTLVPKLMRYPLVKNIIHLSSGSLYQSYHDESGKTEIMRNCVNYMTQMDNTI